MKICKPEYLVLAKQLGQDQRERLLSRMAGKLPRRLEKDKLSQEEALAIQLELEDEQLQEWRARMHAIKAKGAGKARNEGKDPADNSKPASAKPVKSAGAKAPAVKKPAVRKPAVKKTAMKAAAVETVVPEKAAAEKSSAVKTAPKAATAKVAKAVAPKRTKSTPSTS